jgi:hypothetical protein
MSTVRANQFLDAAGGNTATINGMTPTAQSLQGFRNRIINGNMVIDQRNAGASVTPADGAYTIDRWKAGVSAASKFSVQQSSVAPAGFNFSMLCTSLSAYSVGTNDNFEMFQLIEGFNTADLGWGTANAQTVTLSFWVRSSLTGTFGGSIQNSAFNRSYPFSYTISAANTWEQKTITIAGDTSGTWIGATNGTGVVLCIGLGAGSGRSGTAGSWAGATYYNATGAVSVVGTNGATFYITGVQLEAGSVATPFERRDYGRELIMCQRYYYRINITSQFAGVASGYAANASTGQFLFKFAQTMRVAPSAVEQTGAVSDYRINAATGGGTLSVVPTFVLSTTEAAVLNWTTPGLLTAGQGIMAQGNTTNAFIAFPAEL